MQDSEAVTRLDRIVGGWTMAALAVGAAALPWDLYQRVPGVALTAVKIAGLWAVLGTLWDCRTKEGRHWPRTGVEWPIGAFAAVCAFSWIVSIDRMASASQLRVYTTYLLFFCAVVFTVRTHAHAFALYWTYTLSAGVVALLTLACHAGWLWPTFWGTPSWPTQRLLEEYRAGVPMRMAGASGDFNLAAMELCVALAVALFAPDYRRMRRATRVAVCALQVALISAIAASMSRSGLVIAGVLVILAWWHPARRHPGKGAVVILLVACSLLLLFCMQPAFLRTLFDRTWSWLAYDDASVRGRLQVYRIGMRLLPEYWLTGCGLGAFDAAAVKAGYAGEAVMTLHSMPVKLLIELGVLGFLAYVWLWFRAIREVWSGLVCSEGTTAARFGSVSLAVIGSIFVMTLFQPFAALPLYPFVLGLALGPAAWNREEFPAATPRAGAVPSRIASSIGIAVASLLVIVNIYQYQILARGFERYADALEAGLAAEQRADWDAAIRFYTCAAEIAPVLSATDALADEARAVVDVEPVLERLCPVEAPPLGAVAQWAAARVMLAAGHVDSAAEMADEAAKQDPRLRYLRKTIDSLTGEAEP